MFDYFKNFLDGNLYARDVIGNIPGAPDLVVPGDVIIDPSRDDLPIIECGKLRIENDAEGRTDA